MPDASAAVLFRGVARGMHAYFAEALRLSAAYLGIAVIVTVAMGFVLPGLRDQALQVHKALLTALAPLSVTTADNSTVVPPPDASLALAMVVPPAPTSNATALPAPSTAKPGAAPSASSMPSTPAQLEALRSYIARKYRVAYDMTGPLLNTVYKVAQNKRLDPLLLLAVIAIESRYNPLAESHVGAQGLMQVMTSVHQEKFDALGKSPLDPATNISVGATILRDCISRRGSIETGLACYVGATGPDDGGYAAKVLAERRRLALASGIALARE